MYFGVSLIISSLFFHFICLPRSNSRNYLIFFKLDSSLLSTFCRELAFNDATIHIITIDTNTHNTFAHEITIFFLATTNNHSQKYTQQCLIVTINSANFVIFLLLHSILDDVSMGSGILYWFGAKTNKQFSSSSFSHINTYRTIIARFFSSPFYWAFYIQFSSQSKTKRIKWMRRNIQWRTKCLIEIIHFRRQ